MRVPCEIDDVTLANDDGIEIDGVCANCTRCDHETESFGTSEASVKRCLALMREECPLGEKNFYITDDDPEDFVP